MVEWEIEFNENQYEVGPVGSFVECGTRRIQRNEKGISFLRSDYQIWIQNFDQSSPEILKPDGL